MKKVQAIIKPFKLEEVKEALAEIGVQGITLTEVEGYGRQHGHSQIYRGSEYNSETLPKLQLEVIVDDDLSPRVVDAVLESAFTGRVGDGKIFVSPILTALRIRTGETGPSAL
ncbi:MAG: P-II family nitrogen regulator [Verrucomicrobiota bacterium]